MKTIHKYDVQVADQFKLELPRGATIMSVQVQREVPRMWVLVDKDEDRVEERTFRVIGTGHPIDDEKDLMFVGTFQIHGGMLVFHLFEKR